MTNDSVAEPSETSAADAATSPEARHEHTINLLALLAAEPESGLVELAPGVYYVSKELPPVDRDPT